MTMIDLGDLVLASTINAAISAIIVSRPTSLDLITRDLLSELGHTRTRHCRKTEHCG